MSYKYSIIFSCFIFKHNILLFQRIITNTETWRKGTAPIPKPCSKGYCFLPGPTGQEGTQATEEIQATKTSTDALSFGFVEVWHCPLWAVVPDTKSHRGLIPQGWSLSHRFCFSLEASECCFSTAFLIFEMEQIPILRRWFWHRRTCLNIVFLLGSVVSWMVTLTYY